MTASTREEARKLQIEVMEIEIPKLKGREREEALKAYHRLLLSSAGEQIYFVRT